MGGPRIAVAVVAVVGQLCGCHLVFPFDVRTSPDTAPADGSSTEAASDLSADAAREGSLRDLLGMLEGGSPPPGAPQVDTASPVWGNYSSTVSWPHAVTPGGTDRLLLVGVVIRSDSERVSSITYGGVPLTFLDTNISTDVRTEVFYLKSPATGDHQVVLNITLGRMFAAAAISFTGVDQTTPLGTAATASGDSVSPSVSVSSAVGELVVDFVGHRIDPNDPNVLTAGPGQQEQLQQASTSTDHDNVRLGASIEAGAPSVTMSWSVIQGARWAIVAVPLKPSPATH